jgi:monofunctional biosynthetic peptidoglycan transglycosylase
MAAPSKTKSNKKTRSTGFFPTLWRTVKRFFITLFLFQLFYILILKWVNPPVTLTQLSSLFTGHGLKRDYVNLDEISTFGKLSVIASEDQLFPTHNGFDWNSIQKALKHNEKKPNKVRGASTLSQQVAKNVFLWQGRSWLRKGLEMYFTFMIELIWGKKRILEMYLNVSEMGEGVFGIQAAAQHHFKKDALKLSRKEAAMIAATLPNPKKYTIKPMSRNVAIRYPWVLRHMNNLYTHPEILQLIQSS